MKPKITIPVYWVTGIKTGKKKACFLTEREAKQHKGEFKDGDHLSVDVIRETITTRGFGGCLGTNECYTGSNYLVPVDMKFGCSIHNGHRPRTCDECEWLESNQYILLPIKQESE